MEKENKYFIWTDEDNHSIDRIIEHDYPGYILLDKVKIADGKYKVILQHEDDGTFWQTEKQIDDELNSY